MPEPLAPRRRKIMLEDFDLPVDIGFHDFEIGTPQRLRINIEIWLSETAFPRCDTVVEAWDYDTLRTSVMALGRRPALQPAGNRRAWHL
jgi:7,8-dihydroneopterin aldolase/epimerase/oxygenase